MVCKSERRGEVEVVRHIGQVCNAVDRVKSCNTAAQAESGLARI